MGGNRRADAAMLVALTRHKFEQLVPLIATGPQYRHYWGQLSDLLQRVLVSLLAVLGVLLLGQLLGGGVLAFIAASFAGLYWLWGPIYWASRRNAGYRRFPYSGFWRGQVLDVTVTEEPVGQQETVNQRGELVIVENRERCLNLEVGDETGFSVWLQAPLRRAHRAITPGDGAELLVFSRDRDLSRIACVSDAYLPQHELWVGCYPCVQRQVFAEVSQQLPSRTQRRNRQDPRLTAARSR